MQTLIQKTALQARNPIAHAFHALARRWETYRLRAKTVATLSILSDRQLRDIGLNDVGRNWETLDRLSRRELRDIGLDGAGRLCHEKSSLSLRGCRAQWLD